MSAVRLPRMSHLGLALLVGLSLRIAAIILYLRTHGGIAEIWEYEEVARNLLSGNGLLFHEGGLPLRSRFLPLFPLLCTFLHKVGGPGFALFYLAHLACAAGVIWLTWRLAADLVDDRSASLAAWLAALEPGLVVYQSYKVHVIAWATLLLLGALVIFFKARREDSVGWAALSGFVCGLGMLARFDVAVVLVVPALAFVADRAGTRAALRACAMAGGVAVAMAPWVARNRSIHGVALVSTSQSGEFLWRGNNPESTGTLWSRSGVPLSSALPEELKDRLRGKDELERDAVFRSAALDFIRTDPLAAIGRWSRSFFYFWWFAPDYSGGRHYSWAGFAARTAYRALYIALMCAALWGSRLLAEKRRWDALLLWAPPLAAAVLHSITFAEGRHRLLVLPGLLILAAHGLSAPTNEIGPTDAGARKRPT